MITLSSVLCILKTGVQPQTDSSRNVIISTKRCQVQMALSCPTTIPVEFSTLEISSGTAIPYYQSIKRSKLPACRAQPPFDGASGLLLVVTIKALGGVPLLGPDSQTAPTLSAWCQDQSAHGSDGGGRLVRCSPTPPERRIGTRYECVHKYFQLLYTSQQSVGLCLRSVIRACREETLERS